jgi:cytochrome c peroxidase
MIKRIVIGLCAAVIVAFSIDRISQQPVQLQIPIDWPEPFYKIETKDLTVEGIELGRKLFHEPLLSADNSISCASCHLSYTAFSHVDHRLSHGINDSIGTRNAPALMNLAWNRSFMWDGAVNHLDVQALAPITHPAEMGEDLGRVLKKLEAIDRYRNGFKAAFGDKQITGERLLNALSQFQLTLISANSRYDQMVRGEEEFTDQEKNGHLIFQEHCNSCHTAPLFTNGNFANNGLPIDPDLRDVGRMRITTDPKDSLLFKVPTLRNIEITRPYMHDGRFDDLRQVIAHYCGDIQHGPTLSVELHRPIELSSNERTDVLAFLLTLTDREFLFDPKHAAPREPQ